MKRALLALALAGCAHAPGPLANRPHAPLALLPVQGLEDEQAPVLEDAVCQGLVEGNGGDVTCPSATRAVLAVERQRALASGNIDAADPAAEQALSVAENVHAYVTREGEDWVLELTYAEVRDGPVKVSQKISAHSFDDLVLRSTEAARALLR